MANFLPSALVAGQAVFNDAFQKGEWRLPDSAAIRMVKKAGIASPALNELRTREDRSVNAYMPIRQAAIGGTARAHNHTGAKGDSQATAVSWTTLSEPFSISKKQADNNVLTWAQMYASSLQNAIYNIIDRADAWFVAAAVAAKTGYSAGGGKGNFNTTDDVYEVPAAEANYFFQNGRQCLRYNRYNGPLMVIADDHAATSAERLTAQGSANATNYGFQFGNMEILPTTRSILGSAYNGSALMFETGLVAVLPWIPKQNRKPLNPTKVEDAIGDYGQISVPELGFNIGIHAYSARVDDSSVGGYTQDVRHYFEASIDLGFTKSELSSYRDANDEVIYAIGQVP